MDRTEVTKILEECIEKLASVEHERWSHWQRYMHSKCEMQTNGALLIPVDLVNQWERQINTQYDDLSEKEKRSDREQVEKYLPIILDAFAREP